ncbi:hypothetical protein J6590_072922 [Homalodisca vitripennis]|nr:hypothetical protein J6590_072920 [Homalodisca vitripennis]KAG8256257.1 hypothetical protein J6590_072922 [Homalodisca vitripennis]
MAHLQKTSCDRVIDGRNNIRAVNDTVQLVQQQVVSHPSSCLKKWKSQNMSKIVHKPSLSSFQDRNMSSKVNNYYSRTTIINSFDEKLNPDQRAQISEKSQYGREYILVRYTSHM